MADMQLILLKVSDQSDISYGAHMHVMVKPSLQVLDYHLRICLTHIKRMDSSDFIMHYTQLL